MVIFGAGSFSAKPAEPNLGLIPNMFHLLEINGRNSGGSIQGSISSWSYHLGHGWIKPAEGREFPHKESFGTSLLPSEIAERIETHIMSTIQQKNYVTSAEIEASDVEFKNSTTRAKEKSLNIVAAKHGLKTDRLMSGTILLGGNINDVK